MSSTYKLEQHILECWGVTNDMNVLYQAVLNDDVSKEDTANILLGMKELYEIKFNNLWNVFERIVKESVSG